MSSSIKHLIIGNFGYHDGNICGQTLRTRNIKHLLDDNDISNYYVDTSEFIKGTFQLRKIFKAFFKSDKLILLFGRNGIRYLLPLIYLFAIIFRKEIIYIAIGGWLAEITFSNKFISIILKQINIIFVQTEGIKEKLAKQGFENVSILPNFKVMEFAPPQHKNRNSQSLEVVFFSKIKKEKGLDIIRKASQLGLPGVTIDIYGPIHSPNDKAYLSNLVEDFESVSYKDVIEPKKVHQIISKYDLLLFPTHYEGEGFPGVILDAFIAGLPVIASDWKYNSELIERGVTGHLFDLSNIEQLNNHLIRLKRNREQLLSLRQNVMSSRKAYHYNELAKPLLSAISK